MKKIFFLFLCCLTLLCGCVNNDKQDEITGQIICTLAEDDRKDIISVEHQSSDINVIISSTIEKHNSRDDLLQAKEWFDYHICEIGENLYCNSYILEEQLIIVEETAFIPKEDIKETESYINYVEENGYTCMTLKNS